MRIGPALLVLAIAFIPVLGRTSDQSTSERSQTFSGEIIDTLCSEHKGHQYMMQQMKSMGSDKQTCIQKCVQLGAKLALYNMTSGVVYVITNPGKAEPFDGQRVEIEGSLNKKKITISEIKPAD